MHVELQNSGYALFMGLALRVEGQCRQTLDDCDLPSCGAIYSMVIYFTMYRVNMYVCNSIHISYTPLRRWDCPQ